MTNQPDAKQVAKNLLRLEQFDWPHLSVAVCGKPALRGEVVKRLAELLYKEYALECIADVKESIPNALKMLEEE